jgi:hypothetical protein
MGPCGRRQVESSCSRPSNIQPESDGKKYVASEQNLGKIRKDLSTKRHNSEKASKRFPSKQHDLVSIGKDEKTPQRHGGQSSSNTHPDNFFLEEDLFSCLTPQLDLEPSSPFCSELTYSEDQSHPSDSNLSCTESDLSFPTEANYESTEMEEPVQFTKIKPRPRGNAQELCQTTGLEGSSPPNDNSNPVCLEPVPRRDGKKVAEFILLTTLDCFSQFSHDCIKYKVHFYFLSE